MLHDGTARWARKGATLMLSVLPALWASCAPAATGPAEPVTGGGRAPTPLRGTGDAGTTTSTGGDDDGGNDAATDDPTASDGGGTIPNPTPRGEYSGPGTVVRSATEFVAAVAPGARIVLAADEIDLSELWPGVTIPLWDDTRDGPPPPAGTEFVRWTNPYDGWQLEIHDVDQLAIVGHGSPPPRLVTNPRGSFVLKFVKVEGVTLENLTLGHTTPGYCRGGVLAFEEVRGLAVRDAELFGSGTYGLELVGVREATFERIAVHDCTYGIAVIRNGKGVTFRDSTFRDNEEFELIEVERTPRVLFERCLFEGNRTRGDYPFFAVTASEVELVDSTFRNNAVEVFRRGRVTITSGTFENNPFESTISPI